jgi:hypothetical protein
MEHRPILRVVGRCGIHIACRQNGYYAYSTSTSEMMVYVITWVTAWFNWTRGYATLVNIDVSHVAEQDR